MNVIPVIDILNGVAVHAVRGERSQYKPVESILTKSTDPVQVASAFKKSGFSSVYVADLDAIIDCANHYFSVIGEIAQKTGINQMVDAGVTSISRAKTLIESGVNQIVVGTETLQNMLFVKEAVEHFGGDKIIVSLDLRNGQVIAKKGFEGSKNVFALFGEFKALGVKQFVILDLARVGSGLGVDLDLIKKASALGDVDVYVGGGVRGIADLVEMEKAGAKGALVATSLHTGKISVADLKSHGYI